MNHDEELQIVVDAFEPTETAYEKVGSIVGRIYKEQGTVGLREFVNEIADRFGKELSLETLRTYAYMYNRLEGLPIPEDLPTLALRRIARIRGRKIRERFVDKVNKEGLSGKDILFLLRYR